MAPTPSPQTTGRYRPQVVDRIQYIGLAGFLMTGRGPFSLGLAHGAHNQGT